MKVKHLIILLQAILFIIAILIGHQISIVITGIFLTVMISLDVFLGEPKGPLSELEYNSLPKRLQDKSYIEYIYDYYKYKSK
jgi:hypothetical protein